MGMLSMGRPLNPSLFQAPAVRMSPASLLIPSTGYMAFALSAILAGAVLAFLT